MNLVFGCDVTFLSFRTLLFLMSIIVRGFIISPKLQYVIVLEEKIDGWNFIFELWLKAEIRFNYNNYVRENI